MKIKTSHIGIVVGAITLLILAACASKTPQEQLRVSELDKQTYERAFLTKNMELCGIIENKELAQNCKTTLEEQKLKEEIIASKDASKCGKLTIETLKKSCEIEIKGIIEAEKKEEERQIYTGKQNTLLNEITQTGDKKKCAQLKEDYWISICKSAIDSSKQ